MFYVLDQARSASSVTAIIKFCGIRFTKAAKPMHVIAGCGAGCIACWLAAGCLAVYVYVFIALAMRAMGVM
jgi:hypothetical protein